MAIETTRTIRLDQLEGELNDGGVSVPNGLGSHTVGDTTTIHTYDGDGHIVALADAAQAIVDQHTAVAPTDPRTAVIDGMDISDGDKAKLKAIIIG
jgi:hypothetical protein